MNNAIVIAHRGASAYAPENTMAAFELAETMGADCLELDVQLTKDGKPVVIHDHDIGRTSTEKGLVKDMSLDELRRFDFSNALGGNYPPEKRRILELWEVVSFAKGQGLSLNIETKDYENPYGAVNAITARVVEEYEYESKTTIASINHHAMAMLKREFPNIRTAIAFLARLYKLDEYAKRCGADVLHPYFAIVDEEFMRLARDNGFDVNAWTVDDADEIKRLCDLEVTGIMTNKPDVADATRGHKARGSI